MYLIKINPPVLHYQNYRHQVSIFLSISLFIYLLSYNEIGDNGMIGLGENLAKLKNLQ